MVKYVCDKCNNVFTTKSMHTSHVNKKSMCKNIPTTITEGKVKQYICDKTCMICIKSFGSTQAVSDHIKNGCGNITVKINMNSKKSQKM